MYTEFSFPDFDLIFKSVLCQPVSNARCSHLNDLALFTIIDPAAQIEGAVRPVTG